MRVHCWTASWIELGAGAKNSPVCYEDRESSPFSWFPCPGSDSSPVTSFIELVSASSLYQSVYFGSEASTPVPAPRPSGECFTANSNSSPRSEEHTSELQSRGQ